MKQIILTLLSVTFISYTASSEEYFYQLSEFKDNCGCKSQNGYNPVCLSPPILKLKATNQKDAIKEFKEKICKDGQGLIMKECSCTKIKDDKKLDKNDIKKCRMEKAMLIKKIKEITIIGITECDGK